MSTLEAWATLLTTATLVGIIGTSIVVSVVYLMFRRWERLDQAEADERARRKL